MPDITGLDNRARRGEHFALRDDIRVITATELFIAISKPPKPDVTLSLSPRRLRLAFLFTAAAAGRRLTARVIIWRRALCLSLLGRAHHGGTYLRRRRSGFELPRITQRVTFLTARLCCRCSCCQLFSFLHSPLILPPPVATAAPHSPCAAPPLFFGDKTAARRRYYLCTSAIRLVYYYIRI